MTSNRRPANYKPVLPIFTVIDARDYDNPPAKPSLMMKFRKVPTSFITSLHSATNFVTALPRRRLSWRSTDPVHIIDTEQEEGRLVVSQKKGVIMHQARLDTLPLELLVEIFMKLDWTDLLRARQTCTPLYQASTTKLIWKCFIDEFVAGAKVKPKLERPIELYTSAELERVFFQWTTVEPGWTTKGMKHARQRDIIGQEAAAFQLVEGGRWLLLATRTGSITYHDLDHPDIPERVLIPDQVEWHDTLGVSMDVDIDETEPVLTFNLALSVKRPKCHNAPGIVFGQIFRVHLEFHDGQQEHTLQFRQLVFFPLRRHGYISSLSLLGRFVAFYHMNLERNLPPRIVVIDWLDAVADEGDKSQWSPAGCPERVIYPGRHEGKIRLIPGNRLIVTSQSSASHPFGCTMS
ncbi:hypothetical protein GALMADRAFT_1158987 [Galerina marginata CBS 339.88]|uniref:F-box domain-containing protein n=1 Tax=Galerina marginata (strain CBS 339.88) TaxID=685588 RepID=A0A067SHY6_GALM3|nr:hypothetical protein GALMADRAFT_1158987 [Galerina marginata CBS 339.88]